MEQNDEKGNKIDQVNQPNTVQSDSVTLATTREIKVGTQVKLLKHN